MRILKRIKELRTGISHDRTMRMSVPAAVHEGIRVLELRYFQQLKEAHPRVTWSNLAREAGLEHSAITRRRREVRPNEVASNMKLSGLLALEKKWKVPVPRDLIDALSNPNDFFINSGHIAPRSSDSAAHLEESGGEHVSGVEDSMLVDDTIRMLLRYRKRDDLIERIFEISKQEKVVKLRP